VGDAAERGNFIVPTIFTDTRPEMRIVHEEIFWPVLAVQVFADESDAVRLANYSIYGQAGAVLTNDAARAHRFVRKLRAGITLINAYHPTYNEAPWGGYKQSGIGREFGRCEINVDLLDLRVGIVAAVEPTGWFADRARL